MMCENCKKEVAEFLNKHCIAKLKGNNYDFIIPKRSLNKFLRQSLSTRSIKNE